ncbi:MAG: PAS domain S-box protein [Rubrivivax sp.]|nr:PAS domain S-box protein [Rubrivivax sp.]
MIDTPPSDDATTGARWPRVPAGALLVALALLLSALAILCILLISSARAYVGGESQWSKGQKIATLALLRYAETRDPAEWRRYEAAIAVPLGDRRAREELEQAEPDLAIVREGFLQGDNHADDLDGMIRLFRWFRHVPFMHQAITIWAEADGLIDETRVTAETLHDAVTHGADAATVAHLRHRVLDIDARATPLENRFSATLGQAARTTQNLLSATVLGVALLLTVLAVASMRHEQRRAARQTAALRASEARHHRVLIGSSDGFWEWDLQRKTAYFSPRFEQLLGYKPGSLAPDVDVVQALLHPDDKPAARTALGTHLRQGVPYDVELRMQHRDGRWRWMRSRAQVDRGVQGLSLRLAGSINDITERHAAEAALRRSEVMFRSLWETTSDAVLIIDTAHVIRFANAAAHRLFGHATGSLVGQGLSLLQPARMQAGHVHGTHRYRSTGQRHLDWRASEVIGRHAQGHEIPLEICFSEFELDGQHHFVGFLRDITARKQAEGALREANEQLEARVAERTQELTDANLRLREADRLKSEFLATMSHELRTPLNAILGFSSLLLDERGEPLSKAQRQQLGHVKDAGHHLLALINDLLDLSRIESGRMELDTEALDVAALIQEVLALLKPAATAKGLALAADLPGTLPLTTDRRKLYQVLVNLVNNAIKFTPRGEVRVHAWRADGDLHVAVQDTGIGIPPEQLGALFQPFRQLDASLRRTHEGTGLGLYLSQRLMALLGGRIEVRSEPGSGSCFTAVLPLQG